MAGAARGIIVAAESRTAHHKPASRGSIFAGSSTRLRATLTGFNRSSSRPLPIKKSPSQRRAARCRRAGSAMAPGARSEAMVSRALASPGQERPAGLLR